MQPVHLQQRQRCAPAVRLCAQKTGLTMESNTPCSLMSGKRLVQTSGLGYVLVLLRFTDFIVKSMAWQAYGIHEEDIGHECNDTVTHSLVNDKKMM